MKLKAFYTQRFMGFKISRNNHQGLSLRKVSLNLIKENQGLHEHDDITEHMFPTTFNEETEFLSDSNTNSLKRHYIKFYWKVPYGFF
jgi:hypothetical protein